jgi:hypothetical protein
VRLLLALQALYAEIGFARILAYELPDGRLKLLHGHLRRDLDPDMEVDVEILDVNDAEARALLLSIDPLAALAETEEQIRRRLLEITPTDSQELAAAWQATLDGHLAALSGPPPAPAACPAQFLVLVTCRDEKQQVELLQRLGGEGLECKPLLS